MAQYEVGREDVLRALRGALEPLPHVLAMWEAGAVSFDRVDEWSDIDLQVACEDDRVEEVLRTVDETLENLSPVDVRFRLPEPTWHGHAQVFYRLEKASPYLMLDFVVMKASAEEKFLQREVHGTPRVYFDKSGVVKYAAFDAAGLADSLRKRVAELRQLFDLFQVLTLKELNRGNTIEAIAFYHAYTIRPLINALRILHDPTRHNFHTRYLHYDLADEDVKRLNGLMYVADAGELRAKREAAEAWFGEVMDAIGEGPVTNDIEAAAASAQGE
jgi:hypothetical protein